MAWPLGRLAAWLPACGLAADAVLFRQAIRRKPAAYPYRSTPYYLWNYSRPLSLS